MAKKITYSEPVDYFPKEIRKKHKLGEYATDNSKKSSGTKKTVKKKK